MAHTQIKGLPLYPFDADFFSDERIICIDGEFGAKGALTTVALLCAIYRKGYFVRWEAGLKYKLRREICGVSLPFLEMVVGALVRRGFFDKGLFDSDEILTSVEIQRRYFGAYKSSQWDQALPYLLLSEEDFSPDMGGVCLSAPEKGDFDEIPPIPPYSCCCSKNNNILNNNYLNSDNLERKRGAGERKTGPSENEDFPENPKKNTEITGMGEFITELKSSPVWGESVCKNNRIHPTELPGWLDSFLLFCRSEGVEHHSLREVKSHFNRWLPKRIENRKNKDEYENLRQDKSQRRRRTDTSAESAGDYSTSF